MHELEKDLLWIGNAMEARDPGPLFEKGILAVVDVAYDEKPAQLPRQLIYCRFPLVDGGGNKKQILAQAVKTTLDLLASGTTTLIACSAGMSRAPSVAAFALAKHLSEPPADVLARIAELRALEINGLLWKELSDATDGDSLNSDCQRQ